MIRHTFFDKCNTIIENSEYNTGLNPVAELNAGKELTRILIHFDVEELKQSVLNGEYDVKNLKHILKMTNSGSVNLPAFYENTTNNCTEKTRAASFDIIAFRLPFEWDEGRGFDYHGDYAKESNKIVSVECSNWFQARNGMEWDEHGVYFNDTLSKDYAENFGINEDAIIIGRQHFNSGIENLEIDVTDYVNGILTGKHENYGIGLAFSPRYEMETADNKFIAFFTNHTNTFFLPYLETVHTDTILDDRAKFHLGTKNRLYFFVSDNGQAINLDNIPSCTIEGVEYEVKQAGKGVYYAEVLLKKGDVEVDTILTDIWGNIALNGEILDDVEMEFTVLPIEKKIMLGKHNVPGAYFVPQLSGINEKERIKIGDVREVLVDFIEEYSYGKKVVPAESHYRLYVKEGGKEIDIFPYQPIERKYDTHSFIINSNDLVPNNYHIDIKAVQGRNIKHFENVLEFSVVSNITNFGI